MGEYAVSVAPGLCGNGRGANVRRRSGEGGEACMMEAAGQPGLLRHNGNELTCVAGAWKITRTCKGPKKSPSPHRHQLRRQHGDVGDRACRGRDDNTAQHDKKWGGVRGATSNSQPSNTCRGQRLLIDKTAVCDSEHGPSGQSRPWNNIPQRGCVPGAQVLAAVTDQAADCSAAARSRTVKSTASENVEGATTSAEVGDRRRAVLLQAGAWRPRPPS